METLVSDLIQSERKRCVRTPQVEAADFLLNHRRDDASVDLELGCTDAKKDFQSVAAIQPYGPNFMPSAREFRVLYVPRGISFGSATVCVNEYTPGSIGQARDELILALRSRSHG